MKALLIAGLMAALFVVSLVSVPFIASAVYVWIEYFYPRYLLWGELKYLPYSATFAGLVCLSLVRDSNRNSVLTFFPLAMGLFVLLLSASTYFALYPEFAEIEYSRSMKILFVAVIIFMTANSRPRIEFLLKVILGAIGYYALKGAAVTLLSGGGGTSVVGPAQSFLADRGTFSIAVAMMIPFALYFRQTLNNRWLRFGTVGFISCCIITIVGSYSRAGLLTLGGITGIYLIRNMKLKNIILACFLAPFLLLLIPGQWFERMMTITSYEEDGSAMGRLGAWQYGFELALHKPLLGGGPQAFRGNTTVNPNGTLRYLDAHSYFFELMGETGFLGLSVFLTMVVTCLSRLKKLEASVATNTANLASAYRYSIYGYLIGGLFVGIAFHGLIYYLMASGFALYYLEQESMKKSRIRMIKKLSLYLSMSCAIADSLNMSRTRVLFKAVIANLVYGHGIRSFSYYGLANKPFSVFGEYITKMELQDIQRGLNSVSGRQVADSKLKFYEECLRFQLPTPKVYGKLDNTQLENSDGSVPIIRDASHFFSLLEPVKGSAFIFKLESASYGEGLERFRLDGSTVLTQTNAGEREEDPQAFLDRLMQDGKSYLLQRALLPSTDLLPIMANGSLGTVRLVTVRGADQIKVIFGFLKIPLGGSVSDNFVSGQTGNLLVDIDLETGKLGKAISPLANNPLMIKTIEKHPVTGVVFEGWQFPKWQNMLDCVCTAAEKFQSLNTCGWDVALTIDGPVLIETNWRYDGDFIQVTMQRPLRTTMLAALAELPV